MPGLTRETLEGYGCSLGQAVETLRRSLPRNAVLVGQNIGQDVSWLGLKEGVDFAGLIGACTCLLVVRVLSTVTQQPLVVMLQ
jgi:hypothetical protein